MVKRYRRRRIAKRRFKRKLRIRRGSGYDGLFKAKIIRTFNLTVTSNVAAINVMWGQEGITTGGDYYFNDAPEAVTLLSLFQQYRMIGVKIQLNPVAYNPTTGHSIYPVNCASVTAAAPLSQGITQLVRLPDYKQYNYNVTNPKGIKIYKGIGKFYNKLGQKWRQSGGLIYTPAGTRFIVTTEGIPNNTEIMQVSITWYMKFKGPFP